MLLAFHRALAGTWEQFFVLAAKQSKICAFSFIFHCYYSSRLLKLKEDWGNPCHETVLHWPGRSRESHRSFPPLFSSVFIQEDSCHLFCKTPPPSVTHFIRLAVVEEVEKGLSKGQPGWHNQAKKVNLMVRCLFSCCSHPHLAAVVILISFGFVFTGQQNSILQTHLRCKNSTGSSRGGWCLHWQGKLSPAFSNS